MEFIAPQARERFKKYYNYLKDDQLQSRLVNVLRGMNDPTLAAVVVRLIFGEYPMNPDQLRAFLHNHDDNGPLLILAGAGSGKTHVMTRRIVYLILKGIPIQSIFAVTFTNKAAAEMENRVRDILVRCTRNLSEPMQKIARHLANELPETGWISTFHSACMRMLELSLPGEDRTLLRRYDAAFADGVSLLNPSEKREMLSRMIDRYAGDSPEDEIEQKINQFRNQLITPRQARERADTDHAQQAAEVYMAYQQEKRANRVQDFADLIFFCGDLARSDKEVQQLLQQKFQHVLIDEYQDTNPAQFILSKSMSEQHRRIFAVGDDNQSIYGWRGADVTNIKNFNQSFPDAETITLKQNYRSKGMILLSANEVFKDDPDAIEKELKPTQRTEDGKVDYGEKVAIFESSSEQEEREFINHRIQQLVNSEGYSYGDIAIFYRTNEQKFPIKEDLRADGIPFVELGDNRFFTLESTRKLLATFEVLDAVDRLTSEEVSFNSSGQLTKAPTYVKQKISSWSDSLLEMLTGQYGFLDDTEQALVEHVYNPIRLIFDAELRSETWDRFDRMTRDNLDRCVEQIKQMFQELKRGGHPVEVLDGFRRIYNPSESKQLRQNLKQCESWVRDHARFDGIRGLRDFLQTAEQQKQDDQFTPGGGGDRVQLLTLHAAKGLEFPVVFFSGLEEGLCPHKAPWEENFSDLKEEKRLFYVGITRAEEQLYLTYALRRTVDKEMTNQEPSRFLELLPEEYVERREADRDWKEQVSGMFSS